MDVPSHSDTAWIDVPPDFGGLRATVMGLGRFGGGEAAVRFLADRGAHVIATDLKQHDRLADTVGRLADLPNVQFRLGRHDESDFRHADLIVVNPAVPLDHPHLRLAAENGSRLTSEINLFWLHCRADIIGVTGTNGKSTTASLIHALLTAGGMQSRLGGNIGCSLLNNVDSITADERIVLELSSFQLESLDQIGRSPAVAVVTNFAPNHLERHGSLAAYRHAKQSILRHQRARDVAILNADADDPGRWTTRSQRCYFGQTGNLDALFDADSVSFRWNNRLRRVAPRNPALRGAHNLANLAAAILAAGAAGANLDCTEAAIETFHGLPHRLQVVAEKHGRLFIDDSKATTPESAAAAIDATQREFGRIILLAGGADKQVDLRSFAERIAGSVGAVVLLGATAHSLDALLDEICGPAGPRRYCATTFDDAFDWAVRESRSGDTVLLSPGCASYGWFDDFEQRGRRFHELVQAWTGQP